MNRLTTALLIAARCLFFLAAGVYLGGLISLGAVAAPKIFETLRDVRASVPTSTYLNDPSQLGGEVFGNVLLRFHFVEVGCVIAMVLAIALELAASGKAWLRRLGPWVRIALLSTVVALLIYDCRLTSRVWDVRGQWRSAMGSPQADPLKAEFDRLHKQAESLGHLKAYVLAALLCVTAAGTVWGPGRRKEEAARA